MHDVYIPLTIDWAVVGVVALLIICALIGVKVVTDRDRRRR